MNPEIVPKNEKLEKGLTPEKCIEKATAYIAENGACLFLTDLVGSRQASSEVYQQYDKLLSDLTQLFDDHLPENTLLNGETEQGFHRVLGDGGVAAIDTSDIIMPIIEYACEQYPDLSLRYGVARDGWDKEGVKLLK